ncbi:DUF2232 domain-containing protein [uncultured Sphaerochaeta sp.]|uniref:DUF2232 domain-containing protein n=1 Tax=uncultured Sphaerochaeta sp. TaxID=886478 RepID=UPI002A0A1393|nr:DUF2232 domain-containing protein [uncultured Sphaerochaeta sp.]
MNQSETVSIRDSAIVVGVSFLLSQLVFSNFLFTIPLLVLAPRFAKGEKALIPVGIVALLVLASELYKSREALADPVGRVLLLIGLFIPVVLLVSCSIWILLEKKRLLVRYLASASFGVVVSLLLVIWFSRGSKTVLAVDASILKAFKVLFGQLEKSGLESSLNQASVSSTDTEWLYRMVVKLAGAVLVPMCMGLCGFASFISLGFILKREGTFSIRISQWRLPENTLWVFLGSWTLVLFLVMLKASYVLRALSLNIALGSSVLYAIQGIAIVVHFIHRKSPAVNLGRLLSSLLLLAIFIPGLNVLVVFVLPLLGVTETWIVYRKNE